MVQGVFSTDSIHSAWFSDLPKNLYVFDFSTANGLQCLLAFDIHLSWCFSSHPSFLNVIQVRLWARRGQRCSVELDKTNNSRLMVPWELSFHSSSSWQQNALFSKGTFSFMVLLGVAGQRLWEKPGSTIFLMFHSGILPKPLCPGLLQTVSTETETGYIFLWPPFESQITKYKRVENVSAF